MQNIERRTDSVGNEATQAAVNSLHYFYEGTDRSGLNVHPNTVAEAVRREIKSRLEKQKFQTELTTPKPKKLPLLGAYVNGSLRFQSRDHDAVRGYAADKMRKGDNVWVAAVGSFVTDKVQTGGAE